MNKYTVEILERAFFEINEIYEYIKQDNKIAAVKIYNMTHEAISNLSFFPGKGRLVDNDDFCMEGYRYIVVKPYLIFYKINYNKVTIYHVIDGHRQYDKILKM